MESWQTRPAQALCQYVVVRNARPRHTHAETECKRRPGYAVSLQHGEACGRLPCGRIRPSEENGTKWLAQHSKRVAAANETVGEDIVPHALVYCYFTGHYRRILPLYISHHRQIHKYTVFLSQNGGTLRYTVPYAFFCVLLSLSQDHFRARLRDLPPYCKI